ncbi:hypothetical protein DFH29DRAFT_878011 [Suillus ampliporus]|nr:hypothetical protein DFH29DRAFT_878011 [Suillus ampliporus]
MTFFMPRLLSCAAEIWDNSAPNSKLKGLLDWAVILDDNFYIQDHPLFHKTVGYTYLMSIPSLRDLQLRKCNLCTYFLNNELLWAAIALKKTKATAAANKKAWNLTQKKKLPPVVTQSTQSTFHIHYASPANNENDNEDAEGDDNLELVHEDIILNTSLQQLMPLDILKSIEALSNKFDSLLKKSDRAEALYQEINSQVTALDQQWAKKFSTMEKRMWEIKLQYNGNLTSIGYIANTLANPATTKFMSFNPPPTGLSIQGHPYGQIPRSWVLKLLSVLDTGQSLDQTISTVGKQ